MTYPWSMFNICIENFNLIEYLWKFKFAMYSIPPKILFVYKINYGRNISCSEPGLLVWRDQFFFFSFSFRVLYQYNSSTIIINPTTMVERPYLMHIVLDRLQFAQQIKPPVNIVMPKFWAKHSLLLWHLPSGSFLSDIHLPHVAKPSAATLTV